MKIDCSTSSIITQNVTIAYGSIYGTTLVIVSIYSFHFLFKYNPKFTNSSLFKKITMWIKDVWKRRRCYIPLITHIFDQVTDIAVAMQFYQLAITKSDNDYASCDGLNIWYLFVLTILSMVIYRVISSYLLYQFTNKSIIRLLYQLFDIELFRALYINYLTNSSEPCDPQRFITALEASLESAPQAVIQMIYLVRTHTYYSSIIVLISFLSSLWSIISKLISDDKIIVVEKAKRPNFKFGCNVIIDILAFLITVIVATIVLALVLGVATIVVALLCSCCICILCWAYIDERRPVRDLEDYTLKRKQREIQQTEPHLEPTKTVLTDGDGKKNKRDHCKWISWWYLFRYLWRILDVSGRIFISTLCWICIGGVALTVIISIESVMFLSLSIFTGKWELLFGIVAMVVSLTDGMCAMYFFVICISLYKLRFCLLFEMWFAITFTYAAVNSSVTANFSID